MKRYLGTTMVFGILGLALACSATAQPGSSSGNTDDGGSSGTVDGGSSGVTPVVDSGKDVNKPETGPQSCYDATNTKQYIWTGGSKIGQGKCTSAQTSAYLTACFATGATQATCDAFSKDAANKDCLRCASGSAPGDQAADVKDLPMPAILPISYDGKNFGTLNVGGCATAVLGTGATCGTPVTNLTPCEYGACESCTADDVAACRQKAEGAGGACEKLIADNKTCFDGVTNGKATWEPKCTGGQTGFEKVFPVLVNAMCGPAVP